MNKQPDVTARTRQKFIDAFWAMTEEKPLNRITVGEITRCAGYNRSTFYEYFSDMPSLLDAAEQEILEQYRETVAELMPHISESDISDDTLFQTLFLAMNEKIYRLLGPDGDPGFFPMMRAEVLPHIIDIIPLPKDLPHMDYIISFAYSTILGLVQHWHDAGMDLSEKEVSDLVWTLLFQGIHGLFDSR